MLPTHAAVLLGRRQGPSLDLNFIDGSALDPRIQFSRASSATYFDATGTLQSAGNNVPRVDYGPNPTGRTNWVKNSTMQGAVVGTPGSLPNIWAFGNRTASLTTDVVGAGTENGLPYIDLHIHGTTSDTVYGFACSTAGDNTPAVPGQTWTGSAYFKLVSGSLSNITSCNINIQEYDSFGTTWFGDHLAAFTPGGTLTRAPVTATVGNASAQKVRLDFELIFANGAAIDITLRIAAPQLEQGWTATPWIPTFGSIVTVGAEPLGLLIEEQRTNGIRNPRCEGAVAGDIGSGGSLPTDWSSSVGNGLTWSVVGTGIEDGIPYVDVSCSGTATATSGQYIIFESVVGASPNQAWTSSFYARLISGSISNVAFGVFINDDSGASGEKDFTPTSAPLGPQRPNLTYTTAASGVTFISNRLRCIPPLSQALSFTIRIGAPQLELGAFATSLILPPAGSPAASTRATETATLTPITSWFNPKSGTLYAEAVHEGLFSNEFLATINDGTQQNEYRLFTNGGNGAFNAAIANGGVVSYNANISAGTIHAGDLVKSALAYGTTRAELGFDGTGVAEAAPTAPLPTVDRLEIGNRIPGVFLADGHIRRIRYWPRALSDVQLQQVTDLQSNDETFDLDFTLGNPLDSRIQFSRASGATYFDSTGTLQSAVTNQPRIDHDPATGAVRGLLIEQQRTNSVPNPRCEGAVAGTPGTLPTGWSGTFAGNGLSMSITPSTEGGISAIDIRIFGTTAAAGAQTIIMEPVATIAAATGQTWALSAFVKKIADAGANDLTYIRFQISERDSTPAFLGAFTQNFTPNTSGPLSASRQSMTATLSTAGVAWVDAALQIGYDTGGTIDVTYRVGLPQLEQGAFATSPIVPPAGSPAASTRAAETAILNAPLTGPFSLCFELVPEYDKSLVLGGLDDAVGFNDSSYFSTLSDGTSYFTSLNGGSGPAGGTGGSFTSYIGQTVKIAAAASASGVVKGFNGEAPVIAATPLTFPSYTKLVIGGSPWSPSGNANSAFRRVRYWPRALSGSEIQQVTT